MDKIQKIAGLSIKTFLITLIGILLFGIYIGVILYGTNSLEVYTNLQAKKRHLIYEARRLNRENQALQKEYLGLKQLEPKE